MAQARTHIAVLVLFACIPAVCGGTPPPDDIDLRALQVSEGVVQLFRQLPDSVWPGYDLANTPLVVYRPGKWALLLGSLHDAAGFSAYPVNWPDLGHPVRFHEGQYEGLIGQIVFDIPIDDTTTVAIAVPDATPEMPGTERLSLEEYFFGFVVHEAFHQYQSEAFGEIPWEREERYPILDVENTALAALEMRLLMDALTAASVQDAKRCEDLTRMFVAVRKNRWSDPQGFVSRFEQGFEIREGTAKYVEVRAVDLVKRLEYHSDVPEDPALPVKMQDVISGQVLQSAFDARLADGSVSPEDMPRNRIYPVGAAQGLLLDYFGVDWKDAAQRAGYDFSMVDLLIDRLEVKADSLPGLMARARAAGGLEQIAEATGRLVESYLAGYQEALETFEGQPGSRIEIRTKRSGVSRSRVTPERKWLMDEGRRQLCLKYEAYSLGSDRLVLQVQDCGLLEDNDWEAGIRTVTVFVDGDMEMKLDGNPVVLENVTSPSPTAEGRKAAGGGELAPSEPKDGKLPEPRPGSDKNATAGSEGRTSLTAGADFSYSFNEVELSAGGLFLRCSLPGTIAREGGVVRIDLAGE